jgi:hypothetical protein
LGVKVVRILQDKEFMKTPSKIRHHLSLNCTWSLKSKFKLWAAVYLLATVLPSLVTAKEISCERVHTVVKSHIPALGPARIHTLGSQVQYLKETFLYGARDYTDVTIFARMIRDLPDLSRESWIHAIGLAYRQIPKKSFDPMRPFAVGGRRLLDRALTVIERSDLKFQESVEEGFTAKEAYNRFLDRQALLFSTNYSKAEVWSVVQTIQKEMQTLQTQMPGAPLRVSLGGSFINGKADLLTSDIDLGLSDARIARALRDWQEKLKPTFKALNDQAKMPLEPSTERSGFYGTTNPIVIEITAQTVNLLVYPPSQLLGSGSSNLRYLPPTSYRIED